MNAIADSNQQRSAMQITGELCKGDVLDGKYLLDTIIGEGAMGQVWRAKNLALAAHVAIKVVYAEKHGREALSRLLTEARYEAQLCHPNVVRVFDVREGKNLAYVVMELLTGCTLADVMDEGPLPVTLSARLLLPLLAGLSAAHSCGLVHRDIKPENIFIARGAGGRIYPKLLDFGIAHCVAPGQTSQSTCVVGTPGYMAPEQAFGSSDVDGRADLWALGVVLYEAVTGASAYLCKDYGEYLRVLDTTQPLPVRHDPALWNILQRAMHKSVDKRFAASRELSRVLAMLLRDRDVYEDLGGDFLPEHWAAPGGHIDRAFRRLRAEHAAAEQHNTHTRSGHAYTTTPSHTIDIRSQAPSRAHTQEQHLTGAQRSGQVVSALIGGLLGVCIALSQFPSTPSDETAETATVSGGVGADSDLLREFSVRSGLVELAKASSDSTDSDPEAALTGAAMSAAGSHGEHYAEHKSKRSAPPKTKLKPPPAPPTLSPEIPRDETDRKVRKKPKRAYASPVVE